MKKISYGLHTDRTGRWGKGGTGRKYINLRLSVEDSDRGTEFFKDLMDIQFTKNDDILTILVSPLGKKTIQFQYNEKEIWGST